MPIFKGDNWQHLYKGDGHPAALYKGSKKLAGWTEESQAGVSHAYFDDTYNDKADVTIHGKSTQVVTTGAQLVDWELLSSDSGSFTKTDENYTLKQVSAKNTTRSFVKLQKYDGETTVTIGIVSSLGDNKTIVFTKDSTFKKIKFGFNGDKVDTLIEADASSMIDGEKYTISFNFISDEINAGEIDKIILSKGDTWHDFEPYTGGAPSPSPDYPQEITSVGDSGSVEVVSTGENLYTGGDLYNVTGTESKTFLALGTKMRLDAICDNVSGSVSVYMSAVYYDKDSNMLGSNGREITIEGENVPYGFEMAGIDADDGENLDMSNVRKVRLDIRNSTGYDGVFNVRNIMIQPLIPDKPLNNFSGYEQQPSTATFSTPNGLPGIPVDSGGNYTDADGQQWICDEIDTKAGVYRQRVGKVQYIGDVSEGWENYPNEKYKGFLTHLENRKIADFNHGICNRFPVDMDTSSTKPGLWVGSTSTSDFSTTIYFHNCNPSIASSVGEWRTWLSTHPVTLIYPLATPVETPLSDAVDTFLGGTNLFVSEHEMDVTVKTEDQANPTGA